MSTAGRKLMRGTDLVAKAFAAPVTHPRRKLILVALAHRARRNLDLSVNPVEISLACGLDQSGTECVVDHIRTLDGTYLDSHGALDGPIPMVRVDMTRLAEFDDFGDIA